MYAHKRYINIRIYLRFITHTWKMLILSKNRDSRRCRWYPLYRKWLIKENVCRILSIEPVKEEYVIEQNEVVSVNSMQWNLANLSAGYWYITCMNRQFNAEIMALCRSKPGRRRIYEWLQSRNDKADYLQSFYSYLVGYYVLV